MIKLDSNLIKSEVMKQNNYSGYLLCCQSILSVLHLKLFYNENYVDLMEQVQNMLFWRKSLYFVEETDKIKFAFFVFVNVASKRFVVYQFSFDQDEVLRFCAVYFMTYINHSNDILLDKGWSFLVSKEGVPYNVSSANYAFIEDYINEIKQSLKLLFL